MPDAAKQKTEPLYKKWQAWVATLMPILTLLVGFIVSPGTAEDKTKADKYDKIWAEYKLVKTESDTYRDSLTALTLLMMKNQIYSEMLENKVALCEGELNATTKHYMKRQANRRLERMSVQEQNKIQEQIILDLPVFE